MNDLDKELKHIEYMKKYRQEHLEELKAYHKKWQQDNPDKLYKIKKKYDLSHREQINKYKREWYKKKRLKQNAIDTE